MAELQKLYEALERADAAGDTESAKELATWIKSSSGFSQPKEPEPEAFVPTQPIQATPATGIGAFIPAVKRGALGITSLGGDVLPAMFGRVGEKLGIKGAKEYADRQMAEAVQAQQDIERNYPSAVPSYTNIKGAGDLLTYIVEAVGETIPSVIPSIFTGGAAGVIGRGAVIAAKQAAEKAVIAAAAEGVTGTELQSLAMKAGVDAARKTALKYEAAGALAGSAVQNIPDVYQSIAQSTGKEALGATLVAGGFNTVLDAITPLNLMRIARKKGLSPDELIGGWVKRLGKGFAEGLITEGGTEAAQEMSTAAAEKFVDQNKNFFTEANFVRFLDSGLKGGLGGGVLTGATNVAFNRATPPPPSAKEPPEAAPETVVEPTIVPPTTPVSMLDEAGNVIRSTQVTPEELAASKVQAETITKPTAEQIKADEAAVLATAGADTFDIATPPKPIPKFTGLTPEAAKIVEQVTAGFLPQGLDDAKIKQIAEENLIPWSPGLTSKELTDALIAKQGATNADINATPSGESIEVPSERAGLLPAEGAGVPFGAGLADTESDVNAVVSGTGTQPATLSAEDQAALQDELAAELSAEEAPTEVTPKDYINTPSEYAAVAPGTKEAAIEFAAHERVYDEEDKKDSVFTEKQAEVAEKREAFIESLAPEEKAKVEEIAKKVAKKEEVAKEARSKQRVKTADSATLARRAARKNEYKKVLREIKREEIAASAEKDLEEVINQKETALPGQKAFIGKTAYEKERVVKNLERDINELGDIDDVLKTISDEKANTSATRSVAKKLKELIKNLNIDVDIVFGEVEEGRDGKFDPATNTITMAGKDGKYIGKHRLDSAVLHEIMHYLTDHIFTDTKAYLNLIKDPVKRKDVQAALVRLQSNYNYVKSKLGNKYDLSTIKEFIAEAYGNPDFQMDMGMLPPSSTYTKAINFFTEVARNIARAFGFSGAEEATTYKEVLEDIAQIIAVAPTAELRGTEVSYLKSDVEGFKKSTIPPKVHKDIDFEQHIDNQVKNLDKNLEVPSAHKIKEILTTKEGGNWLTKKFQNKREVLRRIYISLERQGVLKTIGDEINNVGAQFDTAAAISDNLDRWHNKQTRDETIELIGKYAKAAGITEHQALVNLSTYLEVMHEPERRAVKWLTTVPLSHDLTLKYLGKQISPADRRRQILDFLNAYKEPDAAKRQSVVKELRKELDAIVSNKANLGTGITDINDAKYNVVGGLSPEKIESFKQALLNQDNVKPYLDTFTAIAKNIQTLNKNNVELNKIGNFWTAPVDNWATFYGFTNYVPFKGKPDTEIEDSRYDPSKKMLVGLQESVDGMSGRESDSDNIVIQVMIDTVNAARRAGYKDVTLSIKNSVNQKVNGIQIISGKTTTIPFDNNRAENIKKERGQNKIFHYEPDGSITVIELTNKEQREAIRNSYKEDHPFVNMLNSVTGTIGQFHTRYNPSFAPVNFTGDLMMNIFTMGAEFGPATSAQLLKNISAIVGTGGLVKAGRVAVLYNKSGTKELQKYIDPKSADYDPFYADLVEYLDRGGKVSFMQAFDTRSQTSQTMDTIKRGGKTTTKESVDAVIDTWGNMFEFASRAASYKTAKEIYQKQNTDKGMNPTEAVEDAKNRATYYAKNLANFEQVGEYGKIFGAFYMFARPAATGAVRAIEALTPLFRAIGGEKFDDTPEGRALAQQAKHGAIMILGLLGLGVASYTMAVMMADDDDDNRNRVVTDDMDRWQKYMRFHIPKVLVGGRDDVIFQMRWGYGLGAFASAGAQLAALGAGNSSFKTAGTNIIQAGLDSFLPLPISRINIFDNTPAWLLDTATPSAFRPFLEYTMNLDGLGREIYNNRQTRLGDAYTGGDSIPEMYKSAARMLFDSTDGGIDISPNTMYFFANNGADGLAKITGGAYNLGLVATGDKAFNPKTDTILFDSFFGAKSNFDARAFSLVEKQIKEVDKRIKTLETDPEKYIKYVGDNPNAVAAVEFYNKAINQDLKTLRSEANRIRGDRTYTPKDRKEMLDNITQMSNMVKRNLLANFETLGYTP
jgi:hypothetical protein